MREERRKERGEVEGRRGKEGGEAKGKGFYVFTFINERRSGKDKVKGG